MKTDTCARTLARCRYHDGSDNLSFVRKPPERETCKREKPRWGGPCAVSNLDAALRRGLPGTEAEWAALLAAVPVLSPVTPEPACVLA